MPEASLVESELNDVKKLIQAGNFAEAENHLLAMISEAPKNGDTLYMLAVVSALPKKALPSFGYAKTTASFSP